MPPAIVFQALIVTIRLKRVLDEFDLDVDDAGPEQRKLCKAVGEFGGYLRANAASIPNYGSATEPGRSSPVPSPSPPSTRSSASGW